MLDLCSFCSNKYLNGKALFYLLYRLCQESLSWWPSKNEAHCLLKSLSSDQHEKPHIWANIWAWGQPTSCILPVVGGGGECAANICWYSLFPKLPNESVLIWICSSAFTELLREIANENILWQKCYAWPWRRLTKPAGYWKDGKSTTAQVWLLVSQLSSC